MNHSHVLYDSDPHFIVDPISRRITNDSDTNVKLIQNDHNSERFTFDISSRYKEGHDLSLCNLVEVHFLNIESNTKRTKAGVYTIDDLQVNADDENKLVCSWVVSSNATQFVGQLNFVLRFSCVLEDGTIEYAWNTEIYSGVPVSSGIYNSSTIVEDYSDVLRAWEKELKSNQVVSLEQTVVGNTDGGVNVWKATFGDGRTSELKVKNGSRGATSLVGSIETISGSPLNFFVGKRAEYENLTVRQKENLFAIITDDTNKARYDAFIENVISGALSVGKATTADSAETAETAEKAAGDENGNSFVDNYLHKTSTLLVYSDSLGKATFNTGGDDVFVHICLQHTNVKYNIGLFHLNGSTSQESALFSSDSSNRVFSFWLRRNTNVTGEWTIEPSYDYDLGDIDDAGALITGAYYITILTERR